LAGHDRVADAKARRTQLQLDLLDDAQRLRGRLCGPTVICACTGAGVAVGCPAGQPPAHRRGVLGPAPRRAGHRPDPGADLRGVRPERTVVDPSAASFVVQLYKDGLTPTLANNAVLDGIRQVSSLIAAERLRSHRSCAGWNDEVAGYS
jgi:hypothetical protein